MVSYTFFYYFNQNPPSSVEDVKIISMGIKHVVKNHLQSVKGSISYTIEQAIYTTNSIETVAFVAKTGNSVPSLL
ncbi:hypothetical protein bcgnr5386_54090 [Bacillus cereus]